MEKSIPRCMPSPPLLYQQTFGCQMNEYDSLRVRRMLKADGFQLTEDLERADVIFLNTCSVREKAEQKVHSFLGRLRAIKAHRPQLVIIVAGCVAQQSGQELLKRFPYLDLVLGTRGIGSLPRLLNTVRDSRQRIAYLPQSDEEGWRELFEQTTDWQTGIAAPVTVMQGCDNFCTYCIVPYVRGRERSRPSRDILHEIHVLTEAGAREVLLLGQNVNSYGRGLEEDLSFAQLLRLIAAETDIERIRFTTSHPKDLTPELVESFATLGKLCHHIHLPFQSGSDRILKRMNRGYTRRDYLAKIERLRRACPDIAISADVMVGFPGETDADYRETMELIRAVRFDSLFSFRYSDRPFTKASGHDHKVPEAIKAARLTELQAVQSRITLDKNRAEIGRDREILVEGASKASGGQLMGRTSQNRIVNFEGSRDLIGTLTTVRITDAYTHSLKGRRIE